MDSGELLKLEFAIMPGENGTYVIRCRDSYGPGSLGKVFGFTDIDDLLRFLSTEREALRRAEAGGKPKKSSARSAASELDSEEASTL